MPAYVWLTLWVWTTTHTASACLDRLTLWLLSTHTASACFGMSHFVGVAINTCSQCLLRYGSLCGCGHQHMQPVPA
ncbi:hypothetical protein DPMN_095438 [Dreissena polymorpha]|uniref:Secreted protein n=1 Tax=Dreissena polymorpha TaxID=45954 RepID=A0A9D4R3T6_DREPO|nr:hypothetical protein DPMN_095438 [Dreissena polymorpha]